MARIVGLRSFAAAGIRPQPINKGPMTKRRKKEQGLPLRNGRMCHSIPEMLFDGVSLKILADSSSAVRVKEIFRVACAVGYEGEHWLELRSLSRHQEGAFPRSESRPEESSVAVPITNFSGADSDSPLASLRARVASEPPWCVPCSLHASPTLGVGGVWSGYHALTLASPVAYRTTLCRP